MKNIKNLLKKSICAILILAMVLPMCAFAEISNFKWDMLGMDSDPNLMQNQPPDNYTSSQNPPSFTWRRMATNYKTHDVDFYELVVAKDEALTDIVYQKSGIQENVHSPNITFPTATVLYWGVRYSQGGKLSEWSNIRKFQISGTAVEFPVPDLEELQSRIPTTHPRIWTTKDTLAEFRSYYNTSPAAKRTADIWIGAARNLLKDRIIYQEPVRQLQFDSYDEMMEDRINGQTLSTYNADTAIKNAFAYMVTGERAFAEYARDLMLEYVDWDYLEGHSSFVYNEQIARNIVFNGSIIYDWIYDILTEEEKALYVDMMAKRMGVMHDFYTDMIKKWPLNSMGWSSFGYALASSIAMYGEDPRIDEVFNEIVLTYIGLYPNWSYEDGGHSQGTAYSWWCTQIMMEPTNALGSTGIINLYDKAWPKKSYAWNMYLHTYRDRGNFGDGAGQHDLRVNMVHDAVRDIYWMEDDGYHGYRKYLAEMAGGADLLSANRMDSYFMLPKYESVEMMVPYNLQHAYKFSDTGYIAMHSDLADYNDIELAFKASPYGSYSHNHPDNNGFYLSAYGKPLAMHSGYYDAFGTDHHLNVMRQTYAHNSITVDLLGQTDSSITDDAEITGFLHQQDFDLAMGDATKAYSGKLGYFERSIIYVRPDMFVVIDDLKASPDKGKSSFQFWLNAEKKMEIYEEENGTKITNDNAVLDATIQYPKVSAHYSNIWSGADLKNHPITVNAEKAAGIQHVRAWFETLPAEKTKIIATLDIHTTDNEARYVEKQEFEDYIKLVFEDGTVVYVNLGEPYEEVVTSDGWTFTGRALCYTDESIMLVKGQSVKQGETDIIVSDKDVSVVIGKDELSISASEDAQISFALGNNFVDTIEKVTDFDGNEIGEDFGVYKKTGKVTRDVKATAKASSGKADASVTKVNKKITPTVTSATSNSNSLIAETRPVVKYGYEENEGYVTFVTIKSDWSLFLNGKKFTREEIPGKLTLEVDGVTTEVPLSGYMSRTGYSNYIGKITVPGGKYVVEEMSEELIAGSLKPDGELYSIATLDVSTSKDGSYLKLKSIPTINATVETFEDYDAIKAKLAWFKESDEWLEQAPGAAIYTTRDFLSGGTGVQTFDDPGTAMTYEVNVPETGYYKFAFKYVAWQPDSTERIFWFNGTDMYKFEPEKTTSYGSTPDQWRACVINEPIYLEKGKNVLTVEILTGGMWNLDWFGLLKQ